MAGTRRARAAGGRPRQITVWLSDDELAAVAEAAGRAGMAPGAWLGETAVRAAEAASPDARVQAGLAGLAPLYSELMEQRRVLRNVGGNLNDVARHVNSTGALHPSTAQVEQLVARVVERVELAVEQVQLLTRETRAERARAGRAGRLRMAGVGGATGAATGAGQATTASQVNGQGVAHADGRGHIDGHELGRVDGPGRA